MKVFMICTTGFAIFCAILAYFDASLLVSSLKEFAFLLAEISFLFIFLSGFTSWLNDKISLKKFFAPGISSHFKAIILGALTPFCSCSSIPLFKSMLNAGVNFGAAWAFLLTSPLLNPVIFAMLLGVFGAHITAEYVAFVVLFALTISLTIAKCVNQYAQKIASDSPCNCGADGYSAGIWRHFYFAFIDYKKFFIYVFFSVLFGAAMHNYVPASFISERLGDLGIWGIFGASLIGIFLYIRTSFIIPLGYVLTVSGVPLGVVFSFLIAGGGCSLPELIVLKSIMKTKMLIIFIASVLAMANLFGIFLYFKVI